MKVKVLKLSMIISSLLAVHSSYVVENIITSSARIYNMTKTTTLDPVLVSA